MTQIMKAQLDADASRKSEVEVREGFRLPNLAIRGTQDKIVFMIEGSELLSLNSLLGLMPAPDLNCQCRQRNEPSALCCPGLLEIEPFCGFLQRAPDCECSLLKIDCSFART